MPNAHEQLETRCLTVAARLGSLAPIRSFLRDTCASSSCDYAASEEFNKEMAELELASTELISNIIRHGFKGLPPGELELRCRIDSESRLQLEIVHHGRPFKSDDDDVPEIIEPQEHGMGLYLIAECVDSVEYSIGADGASLIHVTKTLST